MRQGPATSPSARLHLARNTTLEVSRGSCYTLLMRPYLLRLLLCCIAACGEKHATPDARAQPRDATQFDGKIDDAARDASGPDGRLDATPAATWGPVDCGGTRACPGQSVCNAEAPGGVCLGCGSDADCPSAAQCGIGAACIRGCQTDADCSTGKRCNPNGQCTVRTCSNATPCPPPYLCTAGLCQRPRCADNIPCPTSFSCVAGVCIEPIP